MDIEFQIDHIIYSRIIPEIEYITEIEYIPEIEYKPE